MNGSGGARAKSEVKTATIIVSVFDGARRPLSETPILMRLRNGNQKVVISTTYHASTVRFANLECSGNFVDDFAVIASPNGYCDAGYFPVRIAAGIETQVSLLSIPRSNALNFSKAKWSDLNNSRKTFKAILSAGIDGDDAASLRYGELMEFKSGAACACTLNLLTSLGQITFDDIGALDFFRELIWNRTGPYAIAPDRFFAWAESSIAARLEQAAAHKGFAHAPANLHPGGTRSYKETRFNEANLQITLHEGEKKEAGGMQCLLVELDIDYYRNAAAHFIGEVLVNAFGSMTDPRQVLALRWTAGRQAGLPDFDPLYTVEIA